MAAGYVAAHAGVLVKIDGTPVALVAEAMQLVSGKYYRVTNAIKRCFDPSVALEIRDNGVAVGAANIEHIDYLNGIVKFAAAYTPTTPITAHAGSYIPFLTIGTIKSFDFKSAKEMLEKSVFGDAAKRYANGLGDFSGGLGTWSFLDENVGVATLEASFAAGTVRVISIEILQDGVTLANGGLYWRGLCALQGAETSAEVASLVETSPKLEGSARMSVAGASGSWPVSWSILDGATGIFV